uniref:Uncharacterized protein n=1 Tax=Dunaliella tertiolecta TaxID=3047 RepID=A0A7S3QUZ0_DUNTE
MLQGCCLLGPVQQVAAGRTAQGLSYGRAHLRLTSIYLSCNKCRAAARLGLHNKWLLDELREASLPFLQSSAPKPHQQGVLMPQKALQGGGGRRAGMDLRQMAQLAYSFGKVCIT